MNKRKRTYILIGTVIVLLFSVLVFRLLFPDVAFAGSETNQSSPYSRVDVDSIVNLENGTSSLYDGVVQILNIITTGILLPLGIVFVSWRVVYLAIFPMIMHMDPLGLTKANVRNGRLRKPNGEQEAPQAKFLNPKRLSAIFKSKDPYSEAKNSAFTEDSFRQHGSDFSLGNDTTYNMAETASDMIKDELRFMIVGVLVVALLWTIVHVLILAAGMFVKMAGGVADSVV